MAFLLSRSRGKSVQKWQPDSARHLEKILTATIMEIAVSGTQVAALRLANEYMPVITRQAIKYCRKKRKLIYTNTTWNQRVFSQSHLWKPLLDFCFVTLPPLTLWCREYVDDPSHVVPAELVPVVVAAVGALDCRNKHRGRRRKKLSHRFWTKDKQNSKEFHTFSSTKNK